LFGSKVSYKTKYGLEMSPALETVRNEQ
jgi:hypothetical protein